MKKSNFKKEKEKLLKEKKEIEKILSSFAKKNKETKDDWKTRFPYFGNDKIERTESEDEVEEYNNLLDIEHRLELKLADIKKAIEKIKKGENYGICEKCGRKIEKARIEVAPETKFCSICAK